MKSRSSREFIRLPRRSGACFVRHGKGDHDLYERMVEGQTCTAPVVVGRKDLGVKYQKQVLRQLGFTREEIGALD